jgi:hypothetical protein
MSGTMKNCTLHIAQEGGKSIPITSNKVTNLKRQVPEFPSKDVIEIGRKYYAHLSEMVKECQGRFGSGR